MLYTFFFFQAEDGIRDKLVTGVQTCALPIYSTGSVFVMSRPQANAKGPTTPDRNARRGGIEGLVQASRLCSNPRMSSTKGDPSRADGPVWPAALAPASTSVRRPRPALRASF